MISYLEGVLKKLYADRIMLLVGGTGYEVLIPAYVMSEIRRTIKVEEALKLHISFNQTERQPKPVLVGFRTELDKEFFELVHIGGRHRAFGRDKGANEAGPGDRAVYRGKVGKGPAAVEGNRREEGGEDHSHAQRQGRQICAHTCKRSCPLKCRKTSKPRSKMVLTTQLGHKPSRQGKW